MWPRRYSRQVNCPTRLRDSTQVALLAGLAWLPISLAQAGYAWDDWVLAVLTVDERAEWHRELARFAPISDYIFNVLGAPGVRVTVALALAVTALAANGVLKRLDLLTRIEVKFVAVFTAVNPLDTSKSLLSTATYSLSLSFFFVAWWLIKKRILWPIALPLFFLSFETGSLAFYALLPFADVLISSAKNLNSRGVIQTISLSMTVICFGAFRFFLRPANGAYAGYNNPANWGVLIALCVTICLLGFARYVHRGNNIQLFEKYPTVLLFALGTWSFAVGLLPYLAVGKYPPFVSMLSRHSLLLGLGTALMIVAIVRFLLRSKKQRNLVLRVGVISTVCVSWFHCFLFYHYADFVADVQAKIEEVEIASNSLVVVSYQRDGWARLAETLGPNFANSFYVWNSLILLSQNSRSDIFSLHESDFEYYFEGRYNAAYGSESDRFGSEEFIPSSASMLLKIRRLGSKWSFMPDYEVTATSVTIPLPGA